MWLVLAGLICSPGQEPLITFPNELVGGHVYATTEIIGVSDDLAIYAQRHVDYGSAMLGLGSSCKYPRVRGAEPTMVQLSLCSVGKGCHDVFPIYDSEATNASCTTEGLARQRLAKAKAAFAAAGIKMSTELTPLRTTSPAITGIAAFGQGGPRDVVLEIPSRYFEPFGIKLPVELTSRRVHKGPICAVVAQNKTLGSVALISTKRWSCVGGMSLKGAAIAPDSKELLVTYWTGHLDVGESDLHAERISLAHIAARLLNTKGFHDHKAKDFTSAEQYFERAFVADPSYAQAAFNLACARALLGKALDALTALEVALHLDKAKFAEKARTDTDLASMRDDPRFKELLD